jgi:hypothetical protein
MISEASASIPAVAAMLDEARRELGYDVLDVITKGQWTANNVGGGEG